MSLYILILFSISFISAKCMILICTYKIFLTLKNIIFCVSYLFVKLRHVIKYFQLAQYLCMFLKSNVFLYVFILLQAFAWWPDLLAEHAEKFWALFTVDMDTVLEAQPQDSWDSFPLFQLLNNFLRNDSEHLRFLEYVKWGGVGER